MALPIYLNIFSSYPPTPLLSSTFEPRIPSSGAGPFGCEGPKGMIQIASASFFIASSFLGLVAKDCLPCYTSILITFTCGPGTIGPRVLDP